jgi:uncharacterized membrane protein YdbT with pleckstrin-like domain
MSYARKLLSRGEEIVFESRQHWLAVAGRMLRFVVIGLAAVALLIWVGLSTQPIGNEQVDLVLFGIGLVVLLVALAAIGWIVWDWRNQEWLITTRRVVRAEGILNKSMSESSLEKINDARLEQSWVGRIFGFGTLDILTAAEEAGGNRIDDFPMIADPVKFKIAMLNQKEAVERPDLAPAAWQRPAARPPMQRAEPMPPRAGSERVREQPRQPSSEDLEVTLERLAGLRDKGLITVDEYEAKKRQLLERL